MSETKPGRAKRKTKTGRRLPRGGSSGRRAAAGTASPAERRRAVAELRVLAHPLRLRLYELFAERPRTTMQVAELLGEPPTRLYHHVNALERAGLLRLRETRPIRGTVEKYYEAVIGRPKGASAEAVRQTPGAQQVMRAAAGAVFEQARQDLFASFRDPPAKGDPGLVLLRMLMIAPPARAATLRKRLLALIHDFRSECGEDAPGAPKRKRSPDDQRWSLTVAFAPSWPRRRPEEEA